MRLAEEKLNSTTAEEQASSCKHVVRQEEEYLATKVATDTQTDKIIISLEEKMLENNISSLHRSMQYYLLLIIIIVLQAPLLYNRCFNSFHYYQQVRNQQF
jgi:hypothetical protein